MPEIVQDTVVPLTKYLSDYKKPDFLVETVDLKFELHDGVTHVTSLLHISRQGERSAPLVLDGVDLLLKSVMLDNKSVEFVLGNETLTINNTPNEFDLLITNKKGIQNKYKCYVYNINKTLHLVTPNLIEPSLHSTQIIESINFLDNLPVEIKKPILIINKIIKNVSETNILFFSIFFS